jgi:hypothetical protein
MQLSERLASPNTENPVRMPLHRGEPVTNIFKLMDICKLSEQVFDAAGKFASNSEVRNLIDRIRQTIAQYEFELRTELGRMDVADVNTLRSALQPEGRQTQQNWKQSLETMLREYRYVLKSQLPAHARAMLKRQFLQLDQFHQDLTRLSQAA